MRLIVIVVRRLSGLLARSGSRHIAGGPKGQVLMLTALCATLLPGLSIAPSARADAPAIAMGVAGPLQPPAAALRPAGPTGDGARGLGLAQPTGPRLAAQPLYAATAAGTDPLPASVDLSQYNPPVGDQGSVASCASWATGYYLRGWYARRDGYYPTGGPSGTGSFAPMYLYSQITHGQNVGTTLNANLDLEVAQGIDTRADYAQGDTDYTDAPTASEQATAASYKIAGYTTLFSGSNQGSAAQQAIEASIAGGNPVALGIPVYDNFWNANATHYYVDVSNLGTTLHGAHAVFGSKYDANGVWIENQWGTGWGLNGWAELSWAFVNQYAWQAVTIRPGSITVPTATATITSSTGTPTAPSTATDTATPVPPTATSTPLPPTAINTPSPVPPTATNTATPVPATPTNTATPIPPTPAATTTTTPVAPMAASAPPTATAIRHAPKPRRRALARHAGQARGRVIHLGARRDHRNGMTYREVVAVPGHVRHVWLQFSYRSVSVARRGASGQSWLEVDVLSPGSGRLLARVLRVALMVPADHERKSDRRSALNSWHHVRFDLTRLRGRRVWLVFRDDHRRGVTPAFVDLAGVRVTTR